MSIEELEKENKTLKSKIKFYEQALKEDSVIRKKYSQTLQTLKEKEKELQELNDNLEIIIKKEIEKNSQKDKILHQQSRLIALGEMIHNIAHQWRQPLSVITTAISTLSLKAEYGMVQNEDINNANDIILKNANELSKTIDIFGNFFNDLEQNETFYVQNVILKNLDMLQNSFEANQIETKIALDEKLRYFGNFEQLFKVVFSILKNSQEAFSLRNTPKKVLHIDLYNKNENIVIDIKDNAGGIDEDIKNKIFDPYFTTKHQTQGTGLGLYLSLEIITKYFNGTILAENIKIEGEGALFRITFPMN